MVKWSTFFLMFCLLSGCLFAAEGEVSEVNDELPLGIIGQVEPVVILPDKLIYNARIDTGATTSSIHAADIKVFERDGKRWVRFKLDEAKNGPGIEIERKVSRVIRVKRHGENSLRRYVVKLKISFGGKIVEREFSLTDREEFDYPVLIGRNVLVNLAAVDVSKSNTLKPEILK